MEREGEGDGKIIFQVRERTTKVPDFNSFHCSKEDEKALRKLLKKMKSQTDQVDAKGKKEHREHDLTGLKRIISDANLSQDKIDGRLRAPPVFQCIDQLQ